MIVIEQVHRENLDEIPNAKKGREDIKYEVYGMEGIPEGFIPPPAAGGERDGM